MMLKIDVVNAFTKGKNWGHFPAQLVDKLYDEEPWLKSNVRGRGKEKLNPTIIAYVCKEVLIILLISHFT